MTFNGSDNDDIILVSKTLNPSETIPVNDFSRKWEKWFHTCITLKTVSSAGKEIVFY